MRTIPALLALMMTLGLAAACAEEELPRHKAQNSREAAERFAAYMRR